MLHSLIIAPFYAKMESLQLQKSFWLIYAKKVGRVSIFYPTLVGLTFGLRHLVSLNKDRLRFDLQYNVPILQKYPFAQKVILYSLFTWPFGFMINYIESGRLISMGSFLWTLPITFFMVFLDGGKGLD